MKILITNDDGFDAGGIEALEQVASSFGELITVAPDRHLSGCGHQLTLDRDMKLVEVAENRFHLDGMPADCVRVAVSRFGPFDWVLSGINDGANLGVDLPVSGTVAAAREACQLSIPAIAISQFRRDMRGKMEWQKSKSQAERILSLLFERILDPGQFWNVNLPDAEDHTPDLVDCQIDRMALPNDYHHDDQAVRFNGVYQQRPRRNGTDVDQCFAGKITISRVALDELRS